MKPNDIVLAESGTAQFGVSNFPSVAVLEHSKLILMVVSFPTLPSQKMSATSHKYSGLPSATPLEPP